MSKKRESKKSIRRKVNKRKRVVVKERIKAEERSKAEEKSKAEERSKVEERIKVEEKSKVEEGSKAEERSKVEERSEVEESCSVEVKVKELSKEELKKANKVAKKKVNKVARKKVKNVAGKEISKKIYEKKLEDLQIELIKLQEWVKAKELKVVVLFEGRDAAGKGGAIKRITETLNPRVCRVVALGVPTEKEKSQWYFQKYVKELPAAGEIVLFDRSWYNRAGVEHVMGFCTENEYQEFLRNCPPFEKMLVRSGIILIKYWFSVSEEEQEKRFQDRINDPTKRWKFSPMDIESRKKWVEYSKAKDKMLNYTSIKKAPWYVVDAEIKTHARLNCISHLLSMIPYEDLTPQKIQLPRLEYTDDYVRPPMDEQNFIPDICKELLEK